MSAGIVHAHVQRAPYVKTVEHAPCALVNCVTSSQAADGRPPLQGGVRSSCGFGLMRITKARAHQAAGVHQAHARVRACWHDTKQRRERR